MFIGRPAYKQSKSFITGTFIKTLLLQLIFFIIIIIMMIISLSSWSPLSFLSFCTHQHYNWVGWHHIFAPIFDYPHGPIARLVPASLAFWTGCGLRARLLHPRDCQGVQGSTGTRGVGRVSQAYRRLSKHSLPASTNLINSLWPGDAIWWHRSGSTLAQVMACCLTAPSHYLNQCWLIISRVLCQVMKWVWK